MIKFRIPNHLNVVLGGSRGSGLYWIDPNGGATSDSFQAFCDKEIESGGWTLVATKLSPSFVFMKTAFSPSAAKTKYSDAASHIHNYMENWEEVKFRFNDVNTIWVIYNRKAGAPNKDKTEFEKFLMGTTHNANKNIYGFYKYRQITTSKILPQVFTESRTWLSIQSTGSLKTTVAETSGLT